MNQAQNDNYFAYDKKLDLSSGGIVYPFTGIRGESKEIWSKIVKNQSVGHSNVYLVRADTVEEQKKHFAEADIVICATGYQSV